MYIGMFVYAQLWDMYYRWDDVKGYVGGWVANTDRMFRVVAIRGQYVKVERMGYSSEPRAKWYNSKRITPIPVERMETAMNLYRRSIEAKSAQEIADANTKARMDARNLSRNTVTRALVHAADNGYCNETVIALVSAGHKMPEGTVTVRATIDIPLHIDGKEDYYIMRDIFGRTRGNLDRLTSSDTDLGYDGQEKLQGMLEEKLSDIGASVAWNVGDSPKIVEQDIEFPAPTIRPIEDVVSAPAAYSGQDF